MRWIPLDPPWLLIPIIGGVLLGAFAGSSEHGSLLVVWVATAIAVACATIGFDRWYEHRHPGGRLR